VSERTISPRYYSSRSHSPPTRLSPDNSTKRAKARTFAQAGSQMGSGSKDELLEQLRAKHGAKTWFEMQL
jgi:hypothetical protein